jgi:predicted RNA-binding protein YlxR (DUF448 family)
VNESAPDDAENDGVSGARARRCILTGKVLPEARLVRFVAAPDGQVVPDVEAKLPGRGLWLTASRAAVEQAVAKKLFSRAAKTALRAEANLAALVEQRLVASLCGALGIARRAGHLILGFDQVEEALRSDNPPAVLIQAAEARPDGARKLRNAALARGIAPFVLGGLGNAELSLALGRENVVHAALKSGRIAERLIFDAGRLQGFRAFQPWAWVGFADAEGMQRADAGPAAVA